MKVLCPETDQIEIPVQADPEAMDVLEKIRQDGCGIASKGTERYGVMSRLSDQGYLKSSLCPAARGVTQFLLSRSGTDAICNGVAVNGE